MNRTLHRVIIFVFLGMISTISGLCFAENLTVTITNDVIGQEQCMDLAPDNKNIAFSQCSNANSQKWHIETASGKYNTIKNTTLPKNICFFSSLNGNAIGMEECNSGTYNSQTYWELVSAGDNHYSLRSKVQTDYLRSGWLSVSDGKVILNAESTPTGRWQLTDTTLRNSTTITNKIIGLDQCMDLTSDLKNITFDECNGMRTQQWFIDNIAGYQTIKNSALADNICLFSTLTGDAVEMRQCNSGTYNSQTYWSVNHKTFGDYTIVSKVQNDYLRNGQLSVNVSNHRLTLNDATSSSGNWGFGQYESPKRNMKGVMNVLLLNTHFTGTTQRPTAEIREALFGGGGQYSSLSEYLTLASHGALKIHEGKTLDDIDIGDAGDTCIDTTYRSKAIEVAKNRGVNIDDYDVIYVEHPSNVKCSYAAVATYPTELTKPGKYITSNASGHKYWMWTHEFGHTLGFRHSNILVNCPATSTGVKIDDSCQLGGVDGGSNDISDTMGGGGGRMYPANYMYDVGWLTDEQFPTVGNGTYKIDPLLDDKGGKQGIRIARNNPDFPYLMLEFRQANRFDNNWPENSPFINGVIVREIEPRSLSSYNIIVQTTPGSSNRDTSPLMPGKTLYDTYSGKVIKVDSVSSNGAIVTISDYIPPDDVPAWSASTRYSFPCQKVTYTGDIWSNGWETTGTLPGSDGKWGVWRKLSSDNFFDECKAGFSPANDTE